MEQSNVRHLRRVSPPLASDWHLALQRTIAEDAEAQRTTALVPTGHRFRRSA